MKYRSVLAVVLAALFLMGTTTAFAASPAAQTAESGPYVLDHDSQPVTCRAFCAERQAEGAHQAVLLQEGLEVPPGDYVATGQELRTYDENGVLTGIQPVAVRGDVTGTGTSGLQQVVRLAQALTGTQPLEGPYLAAGDLNGSGSIDVSDLTGAARRLTAQREDSAALTTRTVPFYLTSVTIEDTLDLYFADPEQAVPYVSVDFLRDFVGMWVEEPDIDVIQEQEGVIVLSREYQDGMYWVELNFRDNTIVFIDYDAFLSSAQAPTILDVSGGSVPFLTYPEGSYDRYGLPISIDLDDYDIELLYQDGQGYLPLQTVSDVFTGGHSWLIYNGQAVFCGSQLGDMAEAYYSAPAGPRSPRLAKFTYDELCLALDVNYGLKSQHDITDFRTLCVQAGLSEMLQSSDPAQADTALSELLLCILDDLHSNYGQNSYLTGQDTDIQPPVQSYSWSQIMKAIRKYALARSEFYPDGTPGYEEVGNTAYVTFDSFTFDSGKDYSTLVPTNNPDDTIELIMYAHSQIMRENSPVDNVVIDLSNNTGGFVNAAIAVVAWYLGGTATININSSLTHAQASTRYGFDINQDGVIDENDSVASKRLFCLTSPVSFSCGNLVPANLKASDTVTMIGKPSSGGACSVANLSTASGTIFTLSSYNCMTTVSNGSYYDIDKGVEVDVPITQVEHFYDREALGTFLDGIYR